MRALAGKRVCLVFEHSLSHYTRLLQEISALREAGAEVRLLTSHQDVSGIPTGLEYTLTPAPDSRPVSSTAGRVSRGLRNRLGAPARARARTAALRHMTEWADAFWVIDYPSLPAVVSVASRSGKAVVYETVDLVPEYQYHGERARRRSLAGEKRLLPRVDGFITAADSYADYYMERYGDVLERRPVVRDNMPDRIVDGIVPTGSPLKILFLGSLMFDRPVEELIRAVALTESPIVLTLQGKNLIGDAPERLIAELGVKDRVRVLGPCPPEMIVDSAHAHDVGVVALRGANENERRASTSKLFTYMAAGLAVAGSGLPGIASVVEAHGNGILVGDMQPDTWAAAFERLAMMPPEEIDAMKQRSLDAAHAHSWESQKPAFIGEFVRAMESKG